jgi:hypothetical protein
MDMLTGITGKTFTIKLTQEEIPQGLSQRTKYVVVIVGDAMVRVFDVVLLPTSVPPQLSVYQFKVIPVPPIAVSVISPESSVQNCSGRLWP